MVSNIANLNKLQAIQKQTAPKRKAVGFKGNSSYDAGSSSGKKAATAGGIGVLAWVGLAAGAAKRHGAGLKETVKYMFKPKMWFKSTKKAGQDAADKIKNATAEAYKVTSETINKTFGIGKKGTKKVELKEGADFTRNTSVKPKKGDSVTAHTAKENVGTKKRVEQTAKSSKKHAESYEKINNGTEAEAKKELEQLVENRAKYNEKHNPNLSKERELKEVDLTEFQMKQEAQNVRNAIQREATADSKELSKLKAEKSKIMAETRKEVLSKSKNKDVKPPTAGKVYEPLQNQVKALNKNTLDKGATKDAIKERKAEIKEMSTKDLRKEMIAEAEKGTEKKLVKAESARIKKMDSKELRKEANAKAEQIVVKKEDSAIAERQNEVRTQIKEKLEKNKEYKKVLKQIEKQVAKEAKAAEKAK